MYAKTVTHDKIMMGLLLVSATVGAEALSVPLSPRQYFYSAVHRRGCEMKVTLHYTHI